MSTTTQRTCWGVRGPSCRRGQTAPCYDADFYPFGGEQAVTNTCPQNYKFKGKERDGETGNDDFGARYYSSRFGRWLSADWSAIPVPVPYANLSNPQTLNLYAMVADNPETFADLDGHGGQEPKGPSTSPPCTPATGFGLAGMPGTVCGGWSSELGPTNEKKAQDQHYQILVVYDSKTSKGTLYLVGGSGKDQRILLQGRVVVGGDGHVTPTGKFHAGSWEIDHRSKLYGALANKPWSKGFLGLNAFGPYQLHIKELESRGVYIHGTMGPGWSPATAISGLAVSQTSHGCVRMCNRDDIALHNLLLYPEGTPITISTNPKDAPEQ